MNKEERIIILNFLDECINKNNKMKHELLSVFKKPTSKDAQLVYKSFNKDNECINTLKDYCLSIPTESKKENDSDEHIVLSFSKEQLVDLYKQSEKIADMSRSGCIERSRLVKEWFLKFT